MSEQTQILKRGMTPTHEMMALWIMENPGGTLREMGAHFGYSVSWLSQVINTDMFRSYLAERMKDVEASVVADIPTKLRATASLAIDRVTEVLTKTEDPELILDSFDKVMHRYGYAPQAKNQQPVQQNNVFFLNQNQFAQVQEKLINAHSKPVLPNNPPVQEDGERVINADSEEV